MSSATLTISSPTSAADYCTHDFNVPQVLIENAGRIYKTYQDLEVVVSLLMVCVPTCVGTLPSTTTWDFAQAH